MLFASADRGERGNRRAVEILSSAERLVTSDHVLVESWRLLAHRLGYETAERQWAGIRAGVLTIEPVGAADLEVAFAIGEAFPDQGFSIVDRTSFAVMQRLGILRVATFDRYFAIYRFGPGKKRAFEIVA